MNTILHLLRNYKKLISITILFIFLQTLGTLYIPTLTSKIINNGIVEGNVRNIVSYGAFMLLTAALTVTASIICCWFSTNISSGFSRDLREQIFDKIQKLSINDFNKINTASMITRATSDVNLIGQSTMMFVQMLLPAPIMAIIGLVLAFHKNKTMSLIILVTMFVFLLIIAVMGKKIIPLFKLIQIKMDSINRLLRETIIGVRVIRAFNREKYEKKRIDAAFYDYADNAIKINKFFAFMFPIIMLTMDLGIVCILWFGGKMVVKGTLQIGDILAMTEYCILILYSFIMGSFAFIYLPRTMVSLERIGEIFDILPEIEDRKEELKKPTEYAHIQFCNVTFQYPNAEEPVLSDLSFQSNSGEITAIIGGTGSGKSTIANLILRFFEVQTGSIKVDGIDVRDFSQKELRDKIGFIPQKTFLFSGTISQNIKYGKQTATQEEIEHAAKVAQAHDFIIGMNLSYDSYVSQSGNNLSGGQKQRLAIARALIRKPEIYIFDDSFSALDFETDAKLRKALKSEIGNSTLIIIAQRISTIMNADRIIVLDEGKIVGIGKHEALMESCPVYKQIAASQLNASRCS